MGETGVKVTVCRSVGLQVMVHMSRPVLFHLACMVYHSFAAVVLSRLKFEAPEYNPFHGRKPSY